MKKEILACDAWMILGRAVPDHSAGDKFDMAAHEVW
jgi:hypothetical protein